MLLGAKDRATPAAELQSENYACMGNRACGMSGQRLSRVESEKSLDPPKQPRPFKRLSIQRREFFGACFTEADKKKNTPTENMTRK